MKQMPLKTIAIAGSIVACATLFSFSWSEQRGVSLSVESAQARVGRPLTPMSVAGVARRHDRRAGYGYGYRAGVVGAGVVGAAAVGTAAAVAATSPNWGWGGGPYTGAGYGGSPYNGNYTGGAYDASAYYAPSAANPGNGWYITSNGMACTSGTVVTGANGLPFLCP